tara:strand:+ start:4515 stop:5117 length:603 start_codon:yes stop_codon:yes gene_type:complete
MIQSNFIKSIKTSLYLFIFIFLSSCLSEYDRTVRKEMSLNKNYTDLIFGMEIGQSQQKFYKDCWELNRKKLVNQGSGNQFVRHVLDSISPIYNPKKSRMELLFYGIFDDRRILTGMKMRISYLGWSPWVKELQKDSLLEEGMNIMDQLFPGNSFFEINKEINGLPVMVKIDGNRQITAYVYGIRYVEILIEDLNSKFKKQ